MPRIIRSSKYNSHGEFWHDGRQVKMQRVWGGIGFDGVPKFACVIGEEQFFSETHYYVLAECELEQFENHLTLMMVCSRFAAEYKISRWIARLDKSLDNLLEIYNKKLYRDGLQPLRITEHPNVKETIDESVAIVHSMLTRDNKRLHFFKESMIPSALYHIPESEIKAKEHPAVTALSCVMAGLNRYIAERITPDLIIPVPEGEY